MNHSKITNKYKNWKRNKTNVDKKIEMKFSMPGF